jgi:hypothetical protein
MLDDFRSWILCRPWSVLPAPLWFLIASPALHWAGMGINWFTWPVGCSKSPLRLSFWHVGAGD